MLTAVLCTMRQEPLFKEMADSFVNALKGIAVELIVVDGLLNSYDLDQNDNKRYRKLSIAINERFPYRHVAPKPNVWQGQYRKTLRDYYALQNARNTGLALARGNHIIFFDDCSVLNENFFVEHHKAAVKNEALAGNYVIYDGKHCFNQDHRDPYNSTTNLRIPGEWLYGFNMSFPLDMALALNGFDEIFDGEAGSNDCEFGIRLENAGCKIFYSKICSIWHCLVGTHEPICGQDTWSGDRKQSGQKKLLLDDGKYYRSNEKLIQELKKQPRVLPIGNDFDLAKLREQALATGQFPTVRQTTVDWRDNAILGKDM